MFCLLKVYIPTMTASKVIHGDCNELLETVDSGSIAMVFTSPPYNVGKVYEKAQTLDEYIKGMRSIIQRIPRLLATDGCVCWQVGNHVKDGRVTPLDSIFDTLFSETGLVLRKRMVWKVSHGLHASRRFSGRYETVSIYTTPSTRITETYPKREEWVSCLIDIPNVKSAHPEYSIHPCQFPVELADRFIIGLTREGDTVLDPFAGTGTTIISAMRNKRIGLGFEIEHAYVSHASRRMRQLQDGTLKVRSMDAPRYTPPPSDARTRMPDEWRGLRNPSLEKERDTPQGSVSYTEDVGADVLPRDGFDLIILTANREDTGTLPLRHIKRSGSLCMVSSSDSASIVPDLTLRNRICCWHKGQDRFSTILWYTKSSDKSGYYFDLDAVRVPSKYPGKRSPKTGKYSGNPHGKNPSNVWICEDGCETTGPVCACHMQRLVRAMCPPGGQVLVHLPRDHEACRRYLEPIRRNVIVTKTI